MECSKPLLTATLPVWRYDHESGLSMHADFAVLGEDPLACKLDRIRHIEVLRTFVAGREVYGPGLASG